MLIVDAIHSQLVRMKLVSYDLRQSVDYKAISTYYMAITLPTGSRASSVLGYTLLHGLYGLYGYGTGSGYMAWIVGTAFFYLRTTSRP